MLVVNMNSKLREHLAKRKIAPIVARSDESNDEVALKVMCVFDHFLEKSDLYSHLRKQPQLFNQLLNFKSFATFNYWRYFVPMNFSKKYVLMCRICKLVGPYHLILSHMAITHNTHIGSKQCLWCNETETKMHIEDNTLQQCYDKYLLKNRFQSDRASIAVIQIFYNTIQNIAKRLGVLRFRKPDRFSGIGRKVKLPKVDKEGDIDDIVVVYENNSNITIDLEKLDTLFKKVIEYFYGGSKGCEFLPNIQSRKRTFNTSCPAVTVKKEKPNDEQLPSKSSKSSTPSKSNRNSTPSTSPAPSNQTQNENNHNLSAESPSEQSTMKIGSIIDHIIESIPEEKMKRNAILKVHSVALKCLKRAYEKRDNLKN